MNASSSTLLRPLQGLGCAALLLAIFQACSGNDTSTPTPPAGPATVEITGIALGEGFFGSGGGSSVLACDYSIGVNVQTTNWTLLGPGRCGGALQCGQLRVSLLTGVDGGELLTVTSAGNGVALDVRTASPPLPEGSNMYAIKVELVDDAGKPYVANDGGNGSAQEEFAMELPSKCPPDASGGSGATAGTGAGGGTSGASNAGAGGEDESAGTAGAGGSAGTAGTGGSAGTEGTAKGGGSAGNGGSADTAGNTGL